MMTKRLMGVIVMTAAVASLKACSASDTGSDGGGTTTGQGGSTSLACVPNEQVSCACAGGTTGLQVCLADGSGYTSCDCTGTGGYDACGDAFCDSTENCRECEEDCGMCAPCDIAPKCEGSAIAPMELAHAVDLDISAMTEVSPEQVGQWLAERVRQAGPAMRVVAAALDTTEAPDEHAIVAHVRKAFRDNPFAAAKVRSGLALAGLGDPAAYRAKFPFVPPEQKPVRDQTQTFTPMADEFPGGTVECGAPMLRVGMFRMVVHDDQDGWAQGNNDEVYCLIEGESENGYEIRVTPLVTIESGDDYEYSNLAGVFWGSEGVKTPGDDLLITYNCIESDDSAAYQALVDSIGDGAGQIGGVFEDQSWGWVFPTIDGVSGVVSSAMAANGDDQIFNAQQQIPLEMQLELTNGYYWSVRRSGGDWDWEAYVRAWGCAEYGQL